MFWKEFWALLVADSFSTVGVNAVVAVPGGSPTGPPRAVLAGALNAPPAAPNAFDVLPPPPKRPPPVFPVAVLPKAGLFALLLPKRPPEDAPPPPNAVDVDAVLLPPNPPKPPPPVDVVEPPPPNRPPPAVDVAPKAGFAPKAPPEVLADPKPPVS